MKNEAKKRITLADIASRCGVSINTVSHALHDKPDVSESVKANIRTAAKEMGYIQNSSARLLRMGRSKTLSVIIGDISNPHFAILIREIEETARKNGYTTFVINTDENEKNEYDAIVSSISQNVDGIILCPAQKSSHNVEFLIGSGVPFTLIGRYFDSIDTNYVVCDDVLSGQLAAEYILSYSRRNAVIMAESYISGARDRLAGIRKIYGSKGVPLNDEDIYTVDACGSNTEILKTIAGKGYEGAVCFSDMLALELLSNSQNIRIVSFDNITSRFPMPYKFASITSSAQTMGAKAVEILMDAIDGNTELQQIVLPTALSEK